MSDLQRRRTLAKRTLDLNLSYLRSEVETVINHWPDWDYMFEAMYHIDELVQEIDADLEFLNEEEENE
jgi:hypothetical protein